MAEGDGDRACGYLTKQAAADLEQQVYEQALAWMLGARCPEIIEKLNEVIAARHDGSLDRLKSAVVREATIDGDRAVVEMEGADYTLVMERRDGEWLITEEAVEEAYGG